MSSLALLPELVGFFSYSRDDDADADGALSALRDRIQRELRGQLGRSFKNFRLWQDKEAIAPGRLWEGEIKAAIEQSVFFIPIVTPTVVKSPYCKFELDSFLAREQALGRSDLVFPILYIRVPSLEDGGLRESDPVLSIIAKRQYVDWREFRHRDVNSTEIKVKVERFCESIVRALHESWVSPEERRDGNEIEAQRQAQAERSRREVEEKRLAEEQERRRQTEAEARRRAEDERLAQVASAKQRAEELSKKEQADALRRVDADRLEAQGAVDEREPDRRRTNREHWKLLLIEGIILGILGLIAVMAPLLGFLRVGFVIASLVLISGITGLITSFVMRRGSGFRWSLLSAVLALVVSPLLDQPVQGGPLSLTLVLVAFFIIEGVASIMFARAHRRDLSGRWRWMQASGMIDLVLAAIILDGPTPAWALGLIVGINLAFGGVALIAMALAARPHAA